MKKREVFFIVMGVLWFVMIPTAAMAAIYLIVAWICMVGAMQIPIFLADNFLTWFSPGQVAIAIALIAIAAITNLITFKAYRRYIRRGCTYIPLRNS